MATHPLFSSHSLNTSATVLLLLSQKEHYTLYRLTMIYNINVSTYLPSPTYAYNRKNVSPARKLNIYATTRGSVFRKIVLK